MKTLHLCLSLAALLCFTVGARAQSTAVTAPPPELVAAWKLSPVYTKYLSVEGFPVLGSAKASDYGLAEAAFLIRQMIGQRPEIFHAMTSNHVRLVVMAPTEMTTDVPEHSTLSPKDYWDRRARGLGATASRPAVSCAEENLLDLPGDPYRAENILIHEFGHAIHERGMNIVDPTFDKRLLAAYNHAKTNGLWKGTYAMQNRMEYWAEATQSWFDCNRANDNEHGPIDTRDKLKPYDPDVAVLLTEVYGDRPWRYTKPGKRPAAEREHLAGFDVKKAGRFSWPKPTKDENQSTVLKLQDAAQLPAASPRGGNAKSTTVVFYNHRQKPVTVEWLDYDGTRKHFAEVRPGTQHLQNTFSGHVWVLSEGDTMLGSVVATESPGKIDLK